MQKVKCRFCGKLIEKKDAFLVTHGKQNWYYCNYDHSIAKSPKDEMYEILLEIFGNTTNTVFYSEFNEISKIHGYKKITSYAKQNKDYLKIAMNKNFTKEYGRIRYFSAIFKNNLGDYKEPKEEIKKDIDMKIYKNNYKGRRRRKSMDELERIISG